MIHTPVSRAYRSALGGDFPRELPIRLFGIVRESIVDGPGLRFVVFVQGCPHHCPGCHNPDSHDPNGGFVTTTTRIFENLIKNPSITGVTFSGGEPFLWGNELSEIAEAAGRRGYHVMTYSGWTYEQLLEKAKSEPGVHRLLAATQLLVDGRFIEAQRDLGLRYRGSRNQRLLDVTCYPNSTAAREVEL